MIKSIILGLGEEGDETLCSLHRVERGSDRTADGDTVHASLNEGKHVVWEDASNGNPRDVDLVLLCLEAESAHTLKAEHRGEFLLSGGLTERAEAEIVDVELAYSEDIRDSVGGDTNHGSRTENHSCLRGWHILFAEVDTTDVELFGEFDTVVEKEEHPLLLASGFHGLDYFTDFLVGSVFHPDLDPTATAFDDSEDLIGHGHLTVSIGNELKHIYSI